MRARPHSAVRQLLFPNGLLMVMGMMALTFAVPVARYQYSFRLLSFAVLATATLLSIRLHSLRAFLASVALFSGFLLLHFGPGGSVARPYAIALLAFNFALIPLVEDVFFDWEAVLWWMGLLAVQWTAFIAAFLWQPALLAEFAAKHMVATVAGIGPLEIMFALAAVLLFLKFAVSPDAVGAGLIWALIVLFPGLKNATAIEAYIALSGTALAISVIERAHWIAYHDELTGLPGRRAFNEALAKLGAEFSMAIVDVDHFKKFNDTYGHDAGDAVLRKVAARLARVGGGGTAFRFGGEEFAIIFPDTVWEDASYHADEVRRTIARDVFVFRGPDRSQRKRPERRSSKPGPKVRASGKRSSSAGVAVTVSIGVSAATADNQDVHDIMEAADKALYQAKDLGRNRVEMAQPRKNRAGRSKASGTKMPAKKNLSESSR